MAQLRALVGGLEGRTRTPGVMIGPHQPSPIELEVLRIRELARQRRHARRWPRPRLSGPWSMLHYLSRCVLLLGILSYYTSAGSARAHHRGPRAAARRRLPKR